MNIFKVNGKTYKARPFDFNLMCDLEEMGVSVGEKSKGMSMLRAYLAICAGKDNEYAGMELNQHIINGGSLESAFDILKKEMDASDFFRALKEAAEQETPMLEEVQGIEEKKITEA